MPALGSPRRRLGRIPALAALVECATVSRLGGGLVALAACTAMLGPAAPNATAQFGGFERPLDIDGGAVPFDEPEAVAVGDFNSDGRQDLAVAMGCCPDMGSMAILMSRPEGGFAVPLTFATNEFLRSIAVGDFDADGNQDVVAIGPNRTHVWTGDGDGGFTTVPPIIFGGGNSMTVGDFDGDGDDDLATTHVAIGNPVNPGSIEIWSGGAGASFDPEPPFTVRAFPREVVAGEFNGDGKLDLAVLHLIAQDVRIYLGGGDLTFTQAGEPLSVGGTPGGLAAGDFDSDGDEDLAASRSGGTEVFLGNGQGAFTPQPRVALGSGNSTSMAVGDFDSDGDPDLAVAVGAGPGNEDFVAILLGDGLGGFVRDPADVPMRDPLGMAVGDFDADGTADLAVANLSGSVRVRHGASEPPLAGNLLVNGGFEGAGALTDVDPLPAPLPAIPGWQRTGEMTFARYGSSPSFAFPSLLDAPRFSTGGLNFLSGGSSVGLGGVTTASQTVDVSSAAGQIDGTRAAANLSAFLGGSRHFADRMTARAEFRNAAGGVLGSFEIGPVTVDERRRATTMQRRAGSARVPSGTRTITVTLTSTDDDTFSSATADNVKLTLSELPPLPPLPPGGGGGGGGGAGSAFGPDTKVTIRLAAKRIKAKGPLPVIVSNGNPFAVTGALAGQSVKRPGRERKPVELRSRPFAVAAGARTTLRLALPKPLREQLKRKRKLALRLSATVHDPAGNARAVGKRLVPKLKVPKARR